MKTTVILVASLSCSVLGGCASVLDMRNQDVTERIEMHAGSWRLPVPIPGSTGTAPGGATAPEMAAMSEEERRARETARVEQEAVRKLYVYGQEIFLTPNKLSVPGAPPVDMYVINQSLLCEPPHPDESFSWSCKPIVDLSGAIPSPSPTMSQCLATWRILNYESNLVGVIDDKYCLLVTVVERKKCGVKCAQKTRKRPTNIERDTLRVYLFHALYGGPGGAGAVVGGSHPQFRAPPTRATLNKE